MNPLKNERGGSLIEFVLIAWALFLILFGIMEFGLIMYNQAVITNASREGARYGIVSRATRYTSPEIVTYVSQAYADRPITFGARLFEVSPTWVSQNFGDDLTVEVTWSYDFLLLPNFTGVGVLSNPLTLRASTVMKYE